MLVHYKHLNDKAIEPTKAHRDDACYDLYATEPIIIDSYAVVSTGLAIRIPRGFVGMICSRSGLAADSGVFVLNAPGIIDAGYHGEIKIVLGAMAPHLVRAGDRIAQLMILPLYDISLLRGDNMVWGLTERGVDGLGSSGN